MRIVIVRRDSLDLADGIGDFVFHLADELLERGHEVICFSTWKPSPETMRRQFSRRHYPELESLSAHANGGHREMAMQWLTRGRHRMAQLHPDLALVNGVIPIRLPCPSVAISHDLEQRLGRFPSARILYKRFAYRLNNQIVATCSELAEALSVELRIKRQQITVIPTCVEIPPKTGPSFALRERAFLHMGSAPYKAPGSSIAAFGRLNDPTARLYLTGRPNPTIEAALAELPVPLRSQVELLGWVSAQRLQELIATVRCVCVPSVYHVPVCSPTVLESFAAGTPVICNSSITTDMLHPGGNALMAEGPEAVGAAMKNLLNDEPLWTRLSQSARLTAEKFSASAVADQYLALINRLLSQ